MNKTIKALFLSHFITAIAGLSQPPSTPKIRVNPMEVDFRLVAVDLRVPKPLVIKNVGEALLSVALAIKDSLDDEHFYLAEADRQFDLAKDEVREIAISFMSNAVGKKKALLSISSNDPDSGSIEVTLKAEAYHAPILKLVDTPLRYTDKLAAEETEVFEIHNSGGGTLGLAIASLPTWIAVVLSDDEIDERENPAKATVTIRREGLCTRPPFQDNLTVIASDVTVDPPRILDTMEVALEIHVNNPAPKVNADFNDATIAFKDSKQVLFLALDSIFTDLNFDSSANNNLDYDVMVDSVGVIQWEFYGHRLKIISQNDGLANLTLSANDDGCNYDTVSFFVEVNRRPNIVHTPPTAAQTTNESLTLAIAITNNDPSTEVFLFYRQGGGEERMMQITPSGPGDYKASISKDEVTSRGLDYYIFASNAQGKSFDPEHGFHSIRVFVQEGVSNNAPQPAGNTQNGYRLISFPLALLETSPQAILEDDLGDYDKSQWRFFELLEDYAALSSSEKIYREFDAIAQISPGKAYLLLVKQGGKHLDTKAGTTFFTNRSHAMQLHPGFNLIGSIFNYPIPFANLSLKSGHKLEAWSYSGDEAVPIDIAKDAMQPFEGYFIANRSNARDSLRINPILFPRAALAKQLAIDSSPKEQWAIQILARCQNARDTYNKASVFAEAALGYDALDSPEVLTIGEFVSAYFSHPEWQQVFSKYATDARPIPLTGETWDFEVISNIHDRVDLTFEGMAQVPREFEVWLVDEELQITRDLRVENQYSIIGPSPANPKRLKLVVGKKEYVGEITKQAEATLTSFELSQNFPNPFNPATEIRYGLPHAARITLRIFNMLGEEIAAPVQAEWKTPGYHTAIWNGRNAGGVRVGSGVYVYKLQAGSFTQVRKMLLLQ